MAFMVTSVLCVVVPVGVIAPRLDARVEMTAERFANVLVLAAASGAGVLFLLTALFTVFGRRFLERR